MTPSAPVRTTTTARADRRRRVTPRTVLRHTFLTVASLAWVVPLYIVIVNSFKSQTDILTGPLEIPFDRLSLQYLARALTDPNLNVVGAYGFTMLLVVTVNLAAIAVSGPAAYWIARGIKRRHVAVLFYLLLGTFIPAQAILIPVTQVLRTLGFMNSFVGLAAFQTVMAIPVTVFLFVGYIRTIPRSIDEAAMIDGAGVLRRFWRIIFPLMRPIVATAVILTSMGVWNDFVNPQIIMGPFGPKTVTTGVYAAFGQYFTDFTTVFPNLLLVLAPVLVFFIAMQRNIVSGLTSGSTK